MACHNAKAEKQQQQRESAVFLTEGERHCCRWQLHGRALGLTWSMSLLLSTCDYVEISGFGEPSAVVLESLFCGEDCPSLLGHSRSRVEVEGPRDFGVVFCNFAFGFRLCHVLNGSSEMCWRIDLTWMTLPHSL